MSTYEEKIIWHEIITRPPTEEELEEFKEIYAVDIPYLFDCTMPDDEQEIPIATKWGVDTDICCYDDGYYLENLGNWDAVMAWAEMPKYKG